MEEIYLTNSSEETQIIAGKLIKRLTTRIFALYGELGSGKTTFVQGLAAGLGIKKRIISPTFVLIRQYKVSPREATTSTPARRNAFYHIDLYRIENKKEIEGLGVEEILEDPQNIIAIEWAEKIRDLLPKKRWDIWFEYISENKRKITIRKLT